MNDCPECIRLREAAELAQRYDWHDGREAWKRLADHKAIDHCLHVATAETNAQRPAAAGQRG